MSKTVILIGGLLAFALCLAAFVVLSVLHIDTTALLTFIVTVWGAIGVSTGVAAWKNTEVIKEQTNGPLDATHKRIQTVEQTINDMSERLYKIPL
jgi:hypothetical protein